MLGIAFTVIGLPDQTVDWDSAESIPWIAPGLVDLQINGGGGQEFSSIDLTPDKVASIARAQYASGVTRFCPTVTTASFEVLSYALEVIAAACSLHEDVDRMVIGIHLEGPYISGEDGRAERTHASTSGSRIGMSSSVCKRERGAESGWLRSVPSTRHVGISLSGWLRVGSSRPSAIRAPTPSKSSARGCWSIAEHSFGQRAHGHCARHPNYLWDQLADDRLCASLIVDGHHLPSEVVKTFVRKSAERCILVSDRSGLAGFPPGVYHGALADLEILADGRLVIAGQDQFLAGARRPIGEGVARLMEYAEVDLATAIRMASHQPSQLMGGVDG